MCLHFYCRSLTGHTLPLPAWRLHPRVGPALSFIKRLTEGIGPLAFIDSGRYGRITKNGYLYVFILCTRIFRRFRSRYGLGFAGRFAIGPGNEKIAKWK